MDINHVVLVGRLTRDAEIRYTNGGLAIAKMGIAINQRRKRDDQWVDEAHFFDAVLMGRQAESLAPYLVKGKQVGIEGQLRQNRWEQDGQRRSKVEIFTTNLQLLGGRGEGGEQPSQSGSYEGATSGFGAETGGSPPQDAPRQSGGSLPSTDEFEDDIPF